MPFICIGPVCIPWSVVWPVVVLLFGPLWRRLPEKFTKPVEDFFEALHARLSRWLGSVPGLRWFFQPRAKPKRAAQGPTDGPRYVDSLKLWGEVLTDAQQQDKAVLVQFGASFCQPCKQITPFVEDTVKAQYANAVTYVKVDVEEAPEVADKLGPCPAIPLFQLWYRGELRKHFTGARKDKLLEMLAEFAANSSQSL
eukprot:RCo004181